MFVFNEVSTQELHKVGGQFLHSCSDHRQQHVLVCVLILTLCSQICLYDQNQMLEGFV